MVPTMMATTVAALPAALTLAVYAVLVVEWAEALSVVGERLAERRGTRAWDVAPVAGFALGLGSGLVGLPYVWRSIP